MRFHLAALVIVATAACHSSSPETTSVPETVPARIASRIRYGDCVEARRQAAIKNDLEVDRLPEPVRYQPPPIPRLRHYPDGVFGHGTSEVRITVLVDTLGRPDMRTFAIVKSTHPWLSKTIRHAVGQWHFRPAELAGCKVPRVFKFAVVSPPRRGSERNGG